MKELGDALRSIFEKIGEFFDLFDLSFLVSGSTTLAALVFLAHRLGIAVPSSLTAWPEIVAAILLCYVLGLVCFAVGRWARKGLERKEGPNSFDKYFGQALNAHGLVDKEPFKAYLERAPHRGSWRLYVRMWAELRTSSSAAASMSLLKRYWVMAATYDGMSVALSVWGLVLLACAAGWGIPDTGRLSLGVALIAVGAMLASAFACAREAGRYVQYQVEEVVASIAVEWHRSNS
jgi:hypothetical protein